MQSSTLADGLCRMKRNRRQACAVYKPRVHAVVAKEAQGAARMAEAEVVLAN